MAISEDTIKIVVAVIAAVVGAGIIFKFVINKKTIKKDSSTVNIKDSKIDGDVAGRDIKR